MALAAIVCRFALGSVFVRAALAKAFRREDFERVVRGYALLPAGASRMLALWLPLIELVCGATLLVGLGLPYVAAVTGTFLIAFSGAVGVNLIRGREMDCGCFSTVAPEAIGWRTLLRNLLLLAMAGLVVFERPRVLSLDGALFGATSRVSDSDALALLVVTTSALTGWSALRETTRLLQVMRRLNARLRATAPRVLATQAAT